MKIDATFITSAVGAEDFPRDHRAAVAFVGRSNVGKSSLINALVRQRVARTSAAPGKTRLANVYRVVRGSDEPFYLVDLPGYGYARGGKEAARGFDAVTRAFFETLHPKPDDTSGDGSRMQPGGAILLVDSRHPGLDSDRGAWRWLGETVGAAGIAATKMDKLSRAQRQRAKRELEAVFEHPVVPVSAVTGEGLDELWILIDRLASQRSSRNPRNRDSSPQRSTPQRATARRPPKK